jgi:hypothetical protein
LELLPGLKDADTVVAECCAPVIEAATRNSLAGK